MAWLTFNVGVSRADLCSTHSAIKPGSVWISGQLNRIHIHRSRAVHRIQEKLLAYSGTNVRRGDPHVFEFSIIVCETKSIKPSNLSIFVRHVHMILLNEFRCDRQIGIPMFDPVVRITPVAFRVESDLRKSCGFSGDCRSYHGFSGLGSGACQLEPSEYCTRMINTCPSTDS